MTYGILIGFQKNKKQGTKISLFSPQKWRAFSSYYLHNTSKSNHKFIIFSLTGIPKRPLINSNMFERVSTLKSPFGDLKIPIHIWGSGYGFLSSICVRFEFEFHKNKGMKIAQQRSPIMKFLILRNWLLYFCFETLCSFFYKISSRNNNIEMWWILYEYACLCLY